MESQKEFLDIEARAQKMRSEIQHLFPDVKNAELKILPMKESFEFKLKILFKGKLIVVTEVSGKIMKGMDKLFKKVLKVLRKKQAKTKAVHLRIV